MKTHLLHLTARACLAAQLAGIFTGTFVPVLALARAPVSGQHSPASRTLPHMLREGETVSSVARQHGLSVAELKKLNQLRTFSRPFDQLGAGDELDVPVASVQHPQATASQEADNAAFWAGAASTSGNLLSNRDVGGAASGMARNMATGAATTEVEKWLGQFGTARVNLVADERLALSGASVDTLLPLYETPDWLAFTQLGYRHREDRHSVNLGLGLRTFRGDWMYGVNTFLDNDLTGHNRRLGLGAEAWTNYLRLSANSYRGLTDWHQSRDLADYDERPAGGFDVRMEGWLPAYPQLGGKLMYEQYRGNEVALFGRESRQKDPQAVTTGVSYTPIPLATLGAERRQGQAGQSDTRFNLGLSYRPGVSWSEQINPDAVGGSRTLAASRHDLVERNNDIVLEYKKQTVISLSLPETLAGKAGSTDTLTATVSARYGVSGIDWDYGEVLAAGGRVTELNKQTLQITYPPYHAEGRATDCQAFRTSAESPNVYHVSAVARDSHGNASGRMMTEITVQPGEDGAVITDGNLKVTKDGAVADGTNTNVMQATVKDANGNPVPGQAVSFTADNGARVTAADNGVTNDDGVVTVTLTNTKAGVAKVTASAGSSSQTVDTTFVASAPDNGKSGLSVGADSILADNNATTTITWKPVDANGNPVTGLTGVSFNLGTATNVTLSGVTESSNGIYNATLKGTMAQTVTVKPAINGAVTGTLNVTVTLTLPTEEPASINTHRNSQSFSVDKGFPTTGFKGATFTIVPKNSKPGTDYNWSADVDWVSVTNGVVTFTGQGTKDNVTITGTTKNNVGSIIKYSFKLNSWFTPRGTGNWSAADQICRVSGASLPTVAQMSLGSGKTRGVGALWSEWGNLGSYVGAGISGYYYRSSSQGSSGYHYSVYLDHGSIYSIKDSSTGDVVCRQGF